jgi:hypothetical protein
VTLYVSFKLRFHFLRAHYFHFISASSSFTSSSETMYDLDASLLHGSTRDIVTHVLRFIESQRQLHLQGMFGM